MAAVEGEKLIYSNTLSHPAAEVFVYRPGAGVLFADDLVTEAIGFCALNNLRVKVNGEEAHPGNVVFCDRLQYLSLTIPEMFAGITPVTSTDPFVVGLFQRTKNAHSFNYYLATGATEVAVLVEARGIVQCFKDGGPSDCKDSGIDIPKFIEGDSGTIDGGTKAVIGKSTFVIEEQQNWNVY